MRIIVAGGRVGVNAKTIFRVLHSLLPHFRMTAFDITIIHGDAERTDRYAGMWAKEMGLEVIPVPFDPEIDGIIEGPKNRNKRMLGMNPDAIIAFPGGPGTRNMIEIGDAKGIPIYDVEIEDNLFRVFLWGLKSQEKATCIIQGSV